MTANARVAMLSGLLACAMVGLGFASVPLYRIFCEATGFAGTTMRISEAKAATIAPTGTPMVIRFDANHRAIPWEFRAERTTQTVAIGERSMAVFVAKNLAAAPITGSASFNVTPEQAGRYFNKVQCFCFTEQTLKPGEEARMPVIFYVDPKISSDPLTKDIEEITLSYTFFAIDPAQKPG